MISLTRAEARKIAVRAQLLDANRPAGLLDMVSDLTMLQLDPTAAVTPSAHLVSWSRLGGAYTPSDLTKALDDGSLIELRGFARPAADIALFRAEMQTYDGYGTTWLAANETCHREILARLTADGPTAARDLPDLCDVPWQSSGWTNNRNVGQMLTVMTRRGEVAVAGRHRGDKLWDLASRVYPDIPSLPVDEAVRERNVRLLASLGIARAGDVGEAGEPATIEDVRGTWRVDARYVETNGDFEGRIAVLSPLDRLIFDRKRMADLFAFDYQLEMYKPVKQRRFGYWAMPVLWRDRLVGKVDATRDGPYLRVGAVHEDHPYPEELLTAEIEALATWLGLEPVTR